MTDALQAPAAADFQPDTARRIVGELADLIRPACARLEVGGSIRRGAPYVKDAELVAIPAAGQNLLTWLDALVKQGVVEKALYGDKQTTRWGSLYRGMLFQGIKVELFLTHEDSWGYQHWLRSGPGEANHYIMGYLIGQHAPIRFVEGDGWYSPGNLWQKPKDKWEAADKVRLRIASEEDLFAVLGMPYLAPNERSEQKYKQLLGWNRAHRWPDYGPFMVKAPVQTRLAFQYDWQPPELPNDFDKNAKVARTSAISPFSVTADNAAAWKQQVFRQTVARLESRLADFRRDAGTYPSYARQVVRLEQEIEALQKLLRPVGVGEGIDDDANRGANLSGIEAVESRDTAGVLV